MKFTTNKRKGLVGIQLTLAISFVILISFLLISEYMKQQIDIVNIKNSLTRTALVVGTNNYDEAFNTIRDGYAGAYALSNDSWDVNLDSENAYQILADELGADNLNNHIVRYTLNGKQYELSNLKIAITPATIQNENTEFEIVARTDLVTYINFIRLTDIKITIPVEIKTYFTKIY